MATGVAFPQSGADLRPARGPVGNCPRGAPRDANGKVGCSQQAGRLGSCASVRIRCQERGNIAAALLVGRFSTQHARKRTFYR
eukprot:358961-Chlamydomonas_euryale.AAC.20